MTNKTVSKFDCEGQLYHVLKHNHDSFLSLVPNLWELQTGATLISNPAGFGKLVLRVISRQGDEMILNLKQYNRSFFGEVLANPELKLRLFKTSNDQIQSLELFLFSDPFVADPASKGNGSVSLLLLIFINEFFGKWMLQLRGENHVLVEQKA